jgi:hypothetical protein
MKCSTGLIWPAGCNTYTPDLDHIVSACIFCCPSHIHITRPCILSKPFGIKDEHAFYNSAPFITAEQGPNTIFIINYLSFKMAEHFVICEAYI